MTVPPTVPAMVLPHVVLFPQALLPLYIFEPRYRQMLSDCLEGDRIFAVVPFSEDRVMPADWSEGEYVAGVGFIRACVGQDDGTSHLVLQGIQRVKITNLLTDKPYPRFSVEPVKTVNADSVHVDALVARLKEMMLDEARMKSKQLPPNLARYLKSLESGEILSDILASLIVTDEDARMELLATSDVQMRLQRLISIVLQCEAGGSSPVTWQN